MTQGGEGKLHHGNIDPQLRFFPARIHGLPVRLFHPLKVLVLRINLSRLPEVLFGSSMHLPRKSSKSMAGTGRRPGTLMNEYTRLSSKSIGSTAITVPKILSGYLPCNRNCLPVPRMDQCTYLASS